MGLRTLVIAQKLLTEQFYQQWNQKYEAAKADMDNREAKILESLDMLE